MVVGAPGIPPRAKSGAGSRSGETAVGKYPVKSIRAMSEVCEGAELFPLPGGLTRHRIGDYFKRVDEAIAMAVMYTANHLDVKAIIALTESGSTALWMSASTWRKAQSC